MTTRKRTVPANGRRRTSKPKAQPKPRLRLVKVFVQPVYVADDGESLREVAGDVMSVEATQWEEWAKDAFSKANLANLTARFQAEDSS